VHLGMPERLQRDTHRSRCQTDAGVHSGPRQGLAPDENRSSARAAIGSQALLPLCRDSSDPAVLASVHESSGSAVADPTDGAADPAPTPLKARRRSTPTGPFEPIPAPMTRRRGPASASHAASPRRSLARRRAPSRSRPATPSRRCRQRGRDDPGPQPRRPTPQRRDRAQRCTDAACDGFISSISVASGARV
jgi:hypothetical protein